ncbi:MAG TPA: hypothetical protein VIY56_17370 [Vicinamibacterales bacterium]
MTGRRTICHVCGRPSDGGRIHDDCVTDIEWVGDSSPSPSPSPWGPAKDPGVDIESTPIATATYTQAPGLPALHSLPAALAVLQERVSVLSQVQMSAATWDFLGIGLTHGFAGAPVDLWGVRVVCREWMPWGAVALFDQDGRLMEVLRLKEAEEPR